MPGAYPQRSLQRVVVGIPDAVELQHLADVRILRIELAGLIDGVHHRQLVARAAHVTHLPNRSAVTEALLDLQVVVKEVRRPEVLTDRVDVISGDPATHRVVRGTVESWACREARENICLGLPCVLVNAVIVDRFWADRVILQAVSTGYWRAEIKKGVHVDLVVEHANPAPHHKVIAGRRLVGKSEAWRDIILVGRENGIDSIALNLQPLIWDENRKILVQAVKRPVVFVAQAQIYVKFARDLPVILPKKIESIDPDKPLRVSDGDRGSRHVASQKIGQSAGRICGCARSGPGCPRVRSGEFETSQRTPEIEFIHSSLPHFTTKTKLVLARNIRHYVGQMAGDVIPALWRRDAHLIET